MLHRTGAWHSKSSSAPEEDLPNCVPQGGETSQIVLAYLAGSQQSRRQYAANGFALVPHTRRFLGRHWVVELAVIGVAAPPPAEQTSIAAFDCLFRPLPYLGCSKP